MPTLAHTDVAVIGGGFYGALLASDIKSRQPTLDVTIVEREPALFTQASASNQGQFHMGYMYSADPPLARECMDNVDRFCDVFGDAIDRDILSLYGIHEDSQISADDYAGFCAGAGLALQPVARPSDIFGGAVRASFVSAEKTFDSAVIQRILMEKLLHNRVRLLRGACVERVEPCAHGLDLTLGAQKIRAASVFNVTFADINRLHAQSGMASIALQHDTFLHFVMDLPAQYQCTAATVIRGPYASLLPSSFRQGHVLASGKFRRVQSSTVDKPAPWNGEDAAPAVYRQAIDEAGAYLPLLRSARYRGYTLGTRSAWRDPATGAYSSRALVFRDFDGLPDYHVVLGGKVGCMFDVLADVRRIVG
ncbi:FAD-dependent oxidoreductase [Noviherbaspirillum suwonense]|uniref:FAD dependent oxidoreductase n=1 Tax=Noviherbaspirillum suwonense TaxID=1224511 RepID=A0ABY1Q120_9BURK|nr:FAD-dependent oxidoreductase [Noviherbaspirillum suwonense]SMP51382.1 FAD dependent oxidoreductase [Noviherbaspirillum suwonense]